MTLLSLDTSSSSTGWALFINGVLSDYGVISVKNKTGEPKMREMIANIYNLIGLRSPATIVIETPVVVRNPQVQRMLTMIFGAVYGYCIGNEIEFQELRPTEWRKLVDPGKKPRTRNELKEWSKQKVNEIFNIDSINDDVSDAILIGQAYINSWN